MENLLLKKLQIKPGFRVTVLNAPQNFPILIGEIPNDIVFSFSTTKNYHALLLFASTKAEMLEALNKEQHQIGDKTICWIMYPKAKTKLASDLNLMQSWEDLKTYNLTPCASAAIDTLWTALRVKPISNAKKSGVGNAEIEQNAYGNYVDVINKKVTLPVDLASELAKNSTALHFYEQLSYSNRKEYVLWILTAKQEKTRIDRIQKTIAKLLAGKKNPSEK
ncbi:MAG: YdeI/OmpD-associated family protein [Bacteroidota bacterium]